MSNTIIQPRFVLPRVAEAIEDTRIVAIQGARQVGKSTLSNQLARDRNSLTVTLDDPASLSFAASDPVGFVSQFPEGLLVIDEIQRAPNLAIALKAVVDQNKRPGQFLITGSANLLDLKATQESLAGRTETITLHSFSQGEINSHPYSFVDAAFRAIRPHSYMTTRTRHDYLELACAGGYPEALARTAPHRRESWYREYLTQILRRDAADISGLQRLTDLPLLLRLIAARSGSTMVWSSLANDVGIPRRTLDPYVRLLETLYLTHTLPAWSTNISARELKQPKSFLLDSGLAASLLGLTATALGPPNPAAGALLEGFVVGEIRRQQGWSEERFSMRQFRDSRGREVDIVLESTDGRVVGIEVKASATVQSQDFAGLRILQESLGDRFVAGYVLHSGSSTHAVGDKLTALPIDALWSLQA